MPSSVQIPVTQTGLEASIQAALKNAGKNAQINLGTNSRQINALAQPLGRITGQADEFTKSMEAANARVFAFGASVGIINSVSKAFGALVKNTIAVEKSLVEINSVLGKTSSEIDKFGGKLFEVAKNTGQSFEAVSKGALELARQGLSTEETLKRINDALILTRLSGLDAEKSVDGLTAAVNSFKSTGITTSEVLNKLVNVSQKYAVSEKDLIEGLKRSSSVAKQAGVSFDELVGIITAVQEKSAVGGAVIGNSFKTIFTRLQRKDTLEALQQLGVEVADVQGRILPATKLLENLAGKIKDLNQIQLAEITEKVGGGFQIDKLISALEDLGSSGSVAFKATKISAESANQAYEKNAALNKTLANLINETTLSAQELGATLGKLGITDSAKNLLGFFNNLLESIQKILGEESALGDVVRGVAKGLGNLITGPGLALFGAIILKLSKDLAQFGFASLKGFFGIGKAAKEVQTLEKSIGQALASNVKLQQQLFSLEGNRAAQIKVMTDAIIQQETAMRRMASTSSSLAAPLYQAGVRGTSSGLRVPKAADGYMPAVAQEAADINRGVGGAKSGDRPVVIPNFNFGGGKKGSMVAHTGEYAIPNFNGSGGTAIFNRDMVRSMGLPSGAKKINAAGGLIPNFAKTALKEQKLGIGGLQGKNLRYDFEKYVIKSELEKNDDKKTAPYILAGRIFESRLQGLKYIDLQENKQEPDVQIGNFRISEAKLSGKAAYLDSSFGINAPKGNKLVLPSSSTKDYDEKLKKDKGAIINRNTGITHSSLFAQARAIIKKYQNTPREEIGNRIEIASSGFIPNFAFNADTVRQYASEIEKYRQGGKYVFPDGTSGYESQVRNVLNRNVAKSTVIKQAAATKRKEEMQKKGAMDFFIDANSLGGIALVTPSRRGSSGTLSAESKILNLPQKPDGTLMDDRLVIQNIQSTGVPAQKNFEQISAEINKLFAEPIVRLAKSLYGKLYSGVSGSEFASQLGQLKSTSKGGILPPGAEGQIFEAAGKAALTSMNQMASAFDPTKENRPFDFTNSASMKEILGIKAVRGDAKRGGGSEKQFKETVNGLVKKSINDSQLKTAIFSQIKQQSRGRKLPENAAAGFIPNFALSPKYIQETLGRIKDGTSGFSAQEQETFLRKFGSAKGAASKGVSLRYLFDKDGMIGNKGLTDMVNSAYRQSSPTASSDQVYKVFEGIAKKEPNLSSLRKLATQKGFVPNFADPLKEAVGREMAAGVPASQIYIDKSPALKNAANPMGLMVANRRDEPAGGFQGINRARREGANPMMYGAAGGFIPNYAPQLANKVQASLGAQFSSDVKNAINDFATKASVAGSDLDALSKELQKTLKALGNSNEASQKVAEESKKQQQEINKNYQTAQESRASKILESDSHKKLAKQLDKVYLEYNKSQKTNQDLQRAEAKAAALLKNTQLGAISQRAIVGSTGSLAATRPNAQPGAGGNRDMLGAIFAVQGAMSVLTGATDGASSSVAKFGNIVAEGVGSFATAAFAIQGISQMGGAIGGIASKLGPYGLAIAGTLALFSIGGKIMDELNGVNKSAAASMAKVAEAAQKAAVKLEDLSPTAQNRIKQSAKGLVSGAAVYEEINQYGYRKYKAEFEGYDRFGTQASEIEKTLQASVDAALAAGVSYDLMWNTIREAAKSGGKITKEEVEKMVTQFAELQLNAEQVKNAFGSLNLNIDEGIGKEFAQIDRKVIEEAFKDPDSKNEQSKKVYTIIKQLQNKLQETNPSIDINSPAAQKLILDQYDMLAQKSKERLDAENDAIEQTKTSIVQDKLKNAIALSIAKARKFELDTLGQQLLKGKELGDLSETALRNIEDQIALREIDRELQDATASLIQEQISQAKKITANSQEAVKLQEKFDDLSEKDLQNRYVVNGLLEETSKLLQQNEGLTKEQKNALNVTLDKLFKENEIKKESLKFTQEQTAEYKEQVRQFDLISQASKRALEDQSFRSEIAVTRSINADTAQIRALEYSKLGKSDSQVRQIDQQIAAIKENTVILEQGLAKEKIIAQLREELIQANKIITPQNRAEYNETINSATTKEALEEIAGVVIYGSPGEQDQKNEDFNKFIENMNRMFEQFDVSSEAAKAAARADRETAGVIPPVINALEMFRRSLLDSSQIIDQKIEDIKLQQLTSISGRELLQGNYDIETLRQQSGQTPAEAARIARQRQNKDLGQLFAEEYAKTDEERALDINQAIVDGSVQFKNNMIEGIMGAVEGTSSLKDGLRSAAYEFVKTINQRMMSQLVDRLVGGSVPSGGGAPSGGLAGFFLNMFASGGKVSGGSGVKDDVPAMLMGGEYVINKKAVQKYGPQFLEAINRGTIGGYAAGGQVLPIQSGKGGFFTPGTYGLGGIEGKKNLLDFATQAYTSGGNDSIVSGDNFASVSLEPESFRLTNFGRLNSPQAEATRAAKEQAFGLYVEEVQAEAERARQKKEEKKAFKRQLIMAVGMAAVSYLGGIANTGFQQGIATAGKDATAWQKFTSGISGIGEKFGNVGSGITSLFSGNIQQASDYFTLANTNLANVPKASLVGEALKNVSGGGVNTPASNINNSGIQGLYRATAYGLASIDPTTAEDQRKADAGIRGYEGFSQTIGASGRSLIPGYSVASNKFPLGTLLSINGQTFRVDDRGGMSNNVIDFFAGNDQNLYNKFASWGAINPTVVNKATGGSISSRGGIDTVPAMLSGGEFIMNRSAAQNIGAGNLQALNAGAGSIVTEEKTEELNDKLIAKLDELIEASGAGGNITINVDGSTGTSKESSEGRNGEAKQQLARQIRDAVLKVIQEEKRLGGSLRR